MRSEGECLLAEEVFLQLEGGLLEHWDLLEGAVGFDDPGLDVLEEVDVHGLEVVYAELLHPQGSYG